MMNYDISKVNGGFQVDHSGDTTIYFLMHYDERGTYIGQTQENMVDEQPPSFFFKPEIIDGVPCVNGKPVPPLSAEEMALASD